MIPHLYRCGIIHLRCYAQGTPPTLRSAVLGDCHSRSVSQGALRPVETSQVPQGSHLRCSEAYDVTRVTHGEESCVPHDPTEVGDLGRRNRTEGGYRPHAPWPWCVCTASKAASSREWREIRVIEVMIASCIHGGELQAGSSSWGAACVIAAHCGTAGVEPYDRRRHARELRRSSSSHACVRW